LIYRICKQYISGEPKLKTPKVAAKTVGNTLKVVGEPVPDEFKIEDGIALPKSARPARAPKYFPFDKLKAGQSFLVLKTQKKGLRPALARFYKANPAERKTIAIRKVEGEALRVWKK
jgi:hypothetical protein